MYCSIPWFIDPCWNDEIRKVCYSAPGKVLITGGYLVLQPPFSGLVLSTEARFYSTVERRWDGRILVFSPQMKKEWEFVWRDGVLDRKKGDENIFMEIVLLYCLGMGKNDGIGLTITLEADNDFYSQQDNIVEHYGNGGITYERLEGLPKRFASVKNNKVFKTGLGSSATLVTSLIASILAITKQLDPIEEKEKLHRMAQFCHCLAQGKIGSGFDISAATFGSHSYTRFSKSILQGVLDKVSPKERKIRPAIIEELKSVLEWNRMIGEPTQWDHQLEKFELPPGIELLIADVHGGSETPGMVRKVLQWRSEDPASLDLWNHIHESNKRIEKAFRDLHILYQQYGRDEYFKTLTKFSKVNSDEGMIGKALTNVQYHLRAARLGQKKMGELCNVEIEPDSQTLIANQTIEKFNSVLGCGVPGAGGYDALYCIFIEPNQEKKEVRREIADYWTTLDNVCPLMSSESKRGGIFSH